MNTVTNELKKRKSGKTEAELGAGAWGRDISRWTGVWVFTPETRKTLHTLASNFPDATHWTEVRDKLWQSQNAAVHITRGMVKITLLSGKPQGRHKVSGKWLGPPTHSTEPSLLSASPSASPPQNHFTFTFTSRWLFLCAGTLLLLCALLVFILSTHGTEMSGVKLLKNALEKM